MLTAFSVVVGGVNGHFADVFRKLTTLNQKNPFSFALIVDDLFADPSISSPSDEENLTALLNGSVPVPFTTYFSIGKRPLPPRIIEKIASSDGEVCENLYFLGKRAVLNTAEGIKIIALGGELVNKMTSGPLEDKYVPFHTMSDVKVLESAKKADILLTSVWPSSVRRGSRISLPEGAKEPPGSEIVARLCSTLKPRYHFSTSPDFFYEREPFVHTQMDGDATAKSITRFISLASFRNAAKQKWLYAFNIEPKVDSSAMKLDGTTASPFSLFTGKRASAANNDHYQRFSTSNAHRTSKRARQSPLGPNECFFCLANPDLRTHLIASIGDDSYLTAAHGPLTLSDTYPSLAFSAHVLIIPLSHSPTLSSISDFSTRSSTFLEMTRYRQALQTMVHSQSKGQLGAVTWEVSRKGGVHTHWQFLPLSSTTLSKGLVEAAFKVEAENERYPTFETVNSKTIADDPEFDNFFRVWIWSARSPADGTDQNHKRDGTSDSADNKLEQGQEKCLILRFSNDIRFDLQFGRRVLAKLLGLEDRINWKTCVQSQEEEAADVEALKAAFKEFDFSLQE